MNTARIYSFETSKPLEVIDGGKVAKLRKDGLPKQTKSNAKSNREDKGEYIRLEDVNKFVAYYDKMITESQYRYRDSYRCQKAIFLCNINLGLRINDLLSIKFGDILDDNNNFKDGKTIKPEKTSRYDKHVFLSFNEGFRMAISNYLKSVGKNIKYVNHEDYVFEGARGGHMNYPAFYKSIKDASDFACVRYDVGTHSLRRSFCRFRYDTSEDKGKMLSVLQSILGHSSSSITLEYIGITKEEKRNAFDSVNIGLDAIIL